MPEGSREILPCCCCCCCCCCGCGALTRLCCSRCSNATLRGDSCSGSSRKPVYTAESLKTASMFEGAPLGAPRPPARGLPSTLSSESEEETDAACSSGVAGEGPPEGPPSGAPTGAPAGAPCCWGAPEASREREDKTASCSLTSSSNARTSSRDRSYLSPKP